MKRRHNVVQELAAALALVVLCANAAQAWKPFTHNTTAFEAYDDAISCDDPVACAPGGSNEGGGDVLINGNHYALDPALAAALRDWPEYYNAGVIGPDGFPDLTYGQSVIHPFVTGEWLQHVLTEAWTDQGDGSLTADEKAQILAFAHGYLTHAAGDLWGHTAVNDWARGVFPGLADIANDAAQAGIAIRHTIVEGYIGDSTIGFDSNPDRNPLNCENAGPDALAACTTDADCTDDPAAPTASATATSPATARRASPTRRPPTSSTAPWWIRRPRRPWPGAVRCSSSPRPARGPGCRARQPER